MTTPLEDPDPWKEPVILEDGDQPTRWIVCGACEGSWRAGTVEKHADGCPVAERDALRELLEESESRSQRLATSLWRARAAGRRLGAYWKTQADGEEALREMFADHWFGKLSRALGFPRRATLTEILNRIHRLRDAPEAERKHWSPIARTVQYMVGREETPLEDLSIEALQDALVERDGERSRKLSRNIGLRQAAERQCDRMRRRWMEAESQLERMIMEGPIENVEASLRAAGLDPVEVAARGRALVARILAERSPEGRDE